MTLDAPFVGSDFTDDDFAAITAILDAAGGVALDHYHNACVKRRIAARIRALKLPGAAAYIELLQADREEIPRLNALLSLHVSAFYRDPTTFAALQSILQERPQLLRWWSAGCAGGEEPYSLALLSEQIAELQGRVKILATDISREILEKARGGIFDPSHLGNLPATELVRSFTAVGGSYCLGEKYRTLVDFAQFDLLSPEPYPQVDLILCRYVLIYFNAMDQEQIVCRFAEALPSGGILVLGRTEALRNNSGLFTPINADERIYQRI